MLLTESFSHKFLSHSFCCTIWTFTTFYTQIILITRFQNFNSNRRYTKMCLYKILSFFIVTQSLFSHLSVCVHAEEITDYTLEDVSDNPSLTNNSELQDSESRHRFLYEMNKVLKFRPKSKSWIHKVHQRSQSNKRRPRPVSHSHSRNKHHSRNKIHSKRKYKHFNSAPHSPIVENDEHFPFDPEYENFIKFYSENENENKGAKSPEYPRPGHVDVKSEYFHPYSTLGNDKHSSLDFRTQEKFPYDLQSDIHDERKKQHIEYPKSNKNTHRYKNKRRNKSKSQSEDERDFEDIPHGRRKIPFYPEPARPEYNDPEHPFNKHSFQSDIREFNTELELESADEDEEGKIGFMNNEFFGQFNSGDKSVEQFKSEIHNDIQQFISGQDENLAHGNKYERPIPREPINWELLRTKNIEDSINFIPLEPNIPKHFTNHEPEDKEIVRMPKKELYKNRISKKKEVIQLPIPREKRKFKTQIPKYRDENEEHVPRDRDREVFREDIPQDKEVISEPVSQEREIYRERFPEYEEIIREPVPRKRVKYRAPMPEPEDREKNRYPNPEDDDIFRLREEKEVYNIPKLVPREKEMSRSRTTSSGDIIRWRAPKWRENTYEEVPIEKFSKRYFNLFNSRFKGKPNQKRSHERLFDRHRSRLNDISNMCGRDSLYASYNPQHKSAVNTLVDMYTDQMDAESFYEMSSFLKEQVHPQMWYASLIRAQLSHMPELLTMERPNPLYLFPSRFFPADVLRDSGYKDSFEQECIPLDERFGEDNGIENSLWYFREDVQLNAHHWIWHLLFPFNSTMPVVRRGEFFYFFHHELVARYISERISNDMPMPSSLNLQVDSVIEEGYNPHLVDGISTRAFAPRPPHLIFPGALNETGFEALYNITILRDRFINILFTGTVFKGTRQVPIHTIDNIDILGDLSEASLQSINPEFYGSIGYHNLGHIFLGSLIGKAPPGIIGVIGDQATAMRDSIFYRWHKLVDTLFQTYKVTHLPSYDLHEGDYPLVFNGIKIMDVDVISDNGGTLNHLHTFWESREFNLDGGLDFNSINNTTRPNVKICAKHLDHVEFTYHFRIECNRAKQTRTRIRIFLAPRYKSSNKYGGHRFSISEQRALFFSLDSFVTILKPGSNILSRKSVDSALTAPWPKSVQQIREDIESGTGQRAKCECGYPHHLLLPKGSEGGMVFDLFVMATDATSETIHDVKPNPHDCTPSHIHCGVAGKPYPDSYPMGYPFDRKPFTEVGKMSKYSPERKKRESDYRTRKNRFSNRKEEKGKFNEDSEEDLTTLEEDMLNEEEDDYNLDERDEKKKKYSAKNTLQKNIKEKLSPGSNAVRDKSNSELHDEHIRIFNEIIKNENILQSEREGISHSRDTTRSPDENNEEYHNKLSSKEKINEQAEEAKIRIDIHPGSKIKHYQHEFNTLEDFVSHVPNMATTQIIITHRDEFGR